MECTREKVLVTGGGGFIGSHLVERLVALGVSTRALVRYTSGSSWGWLDHSPRRTDIEVIAGDICDPEIMRQAMRGVGVVFHLAALISIPYSYHAPRSYVRSNVEGTTNVLQAAVEGDVERFVHVSTSEVYGTAQYVPIPESHPLQAQSPYAATKIGADHLASSFHLSFGLPVVIVRPFNTYGPRQSARAVIPSIITQALVDERVCVGNLQATRDFNYVSDTVEAMILAAKSDTVVGKTINIGNGRSISIQQLAELIFGILGSSARIVVQDERLRPEGSEVERLCADRTLAKELLGWEPAMKLRNGLEETIRWMKHNINNYRPNEYAF
jgi:NAD dependent epimerase/dehydratase